MAQEQGSGRDVVADPDTANAPLRAMQIWIAIIVGVASVILGAYAASQTDWSLLLARPAGGVVPFTAAVVIALTTAASGWWNAGADFSRFLYPQTAAPAVLRAILPAMSGVTLIIILGALLAYWEPSSATAANPLAAVTADLSLPMALLFLVIAAVGLHATAVTNMYSATLNLNSLGVRRRAVSVTIAAVMTIGISWWIIFDDAGFLEWFSSFLTVLGVPLAAWAGVFIVAVVRLRQWPDPSSAVVVWPLVWVVVASFFGLGLVSSNTTGLGWAGYLAPKAELTSAGVGVLVALVIAAIGQRLTASRTWPQQER